MPKTSIKPLLGVIADNRQKPTSTQLPGKKTSPIPALNRPQVNEFANFQQKPQLAGPAGRPSSPAIRPGTVSSVLFSRPEPVQKIVLPDSVALDHRSRELHPDIKGTPSREKMHQALLVLKGVLDPSPQLGANKKRSGLGENDMSLSEAQATVINGTEAYMDLAKWEATKLNKEQLDLALRITSPDGPPAADVVTTETLKMAIREAGKPASAAPGPVIISGGGSLPSAPTSDPVTQTIDALFEKPEEPPEGTFSKIMRFVRRFMGWEDQLGFASNRVGPRGILDTLYQASRSGGFGQSGGFGSQIGNVLGRFGFGGFGGGGAAAAGTAGAGATAGGAAVGGATAGAGAAGAAAGAGAFATAAGVILGVLIIFFLVIFISKNIDIAEIIPIQGTGGGSGSSGSFGPSYDFIGVCWPIAGPGVQVSSTPDQHADRDLSSGGSAIDIAALAGTPVQSSVDGTIIFSGKDGTSRPLGWKPYGGLVVIKVKPELVDNRHVLVYYAHLSKVAHELSYVDDPINGIAVTAGEYIGDVGNTGNSTGDHLHMETINMDINSILPDWQPVVPRMLIPDRCEGGSEIIL